MREGGWEEKVMLERGKEEGQSLLRNGIDNLYRQSIETNQTG